MLTSSLSTLKQKISPLGLLLLAILWAALMYWPGLYSGFVLDDGPNLGGITETAGGGQFFWSYVLGNESGLFGRAVSMFSFAMNYVVFQSLDPFSFKLVNLIIHCLNAWLVFGFSNAVLKQCDSETDGRWLALLVAVLWLLTPLHTSTVLYVVQRMTMLAALFSVAGMWCYVKGRAGQLNGSRGCWWFLLLAYCCLPLAVLSKENGGLLLVMMFFLECVLFRFQGKYRYSSGVIALHLIPILVGMLAIGIFLSRGLPDFLNYDLRPFSMGERLLTESRVFWQYIAELLLPMGVDPGLYHDDIVVSLGLFTPWITVLAVVGLIVFVVSISYAVIKAKLQLISLGLGLFFIGHLLESTIINLELYFEHRNYLPSVGLWLAVVGMGSFIFKRPEHRGYAYFLLFMYLGMQSFYINQEASVWVSPFERTKTMAQKHPDSVRANTEWALELANEGDFEGSLTVFDKLDELAPESQPIIQIQRLWLYCRFNQPTPDGLYKLKLGAIQGIDAIHYNSAWSYFLEHRQRYGCTSLDIGRLSTLIDEWLAIRVQHGDDLAAHWNLIYPLLRLKELSSDENMLVLTGKKYFYAGSKNAGFYLVDFYLAKDDYVLAQLWLNRMLAIMSEQNKVESQAVIDRFSRELEKKKVKAGL